MFVLHALSQATDPPETKLKIASIAFCCLQLREYWNVIILVPALWFYRILEYFYKIIIFALPKH